MRDELEGKLFNKFEFYKPNESLLESLMGFGFECGDGWFDLLWELSENIEKELNKSPIKSERPFKAMQVKEKYGELRYYTNWHTPEILKLINNAENKSCEICETCGKPGETRGSRWLVTLCDNCNKEEK